MNDQKIIHFRAGELPAIKEEFNHLESDGYQWLVLFNPDEETLNKLAEKTGLHPLSVEDCLEDDQIPKMEIFENWTHLLINSFRFEGESLVAGELNLFLGQNSVITITRVPTTYQRLLDIGESLRKMASPNPLRGPSFIIHKIIDVAVDEKAAAMEFLEDEIDKVEEALFEKSLEFDFSTLQQRRRQIGFCRKIVFHERELINRIIRGDSPHINKKTLIHFRDINDHLLRLYELSETLRDTIKSLIELSLSMANNRMAESANATNKTVRRLTFITTIFMPLTLLAGIGGMSEYTMATGPENWRVSYLILVLSMFALGILSFLWLKRFDRGE